MGIFNEQSFDHPFAKGVQGSPGVGFRLTVDGNYDISGKKLTNVGAPSSNSDAATKKYVDDNSSSVDLSGYLKADGSVTATGALDMGSKKITKIATPTAVDDGATKKYVDDLVPDLSDYIEKDGSVIMTGNFNLGNKKIINLATPSSNTDAATKKYVDDTNVSSQLTVNSNIDMKDRYRILNLKHPSDADEPATKQYADSMFLDRAGNRGMLSDFTMNNHKIISLGTPTTNTDAATKKYVDDTVSNNSPDLSDYLEKDGTVTMTGNLNMGNKKVIGLAAPTSNNDAATKKYVDDKPSGSGDFKKDGSVAMTGNFNANNNKIINVPQPRSNNEPVTRIYGNSNYLLLSGFIPMKGNLKMSNNKITTLGTPTTNTDAATKKYVDDATTGVLKDDGSVSMKANFNLNSNKITGIAAPTLNPDVTTKLYVDTLVKGEAIQPSHYDNQFGFLMQSGSHWTDETAGGNSFLIDKIDTLTPANGNFHNFNHRVIYCKLNKNAQGGYKFKVGFNNYQLHANTDYTLCIELLNTEYLLWHKSKITVDKGSSSGINLGYVSLSKLSNQYRDSSGAKKFMYYHRLIINFKRLSSGRYFLYLNVDIPQQGIDLNIYPSQFTGFYLIAYGIIGTFNNLDSNKIYDYHTAFDIKPTEVSYNVDIDMNNKKIKDISLDKTIGNSAATVSMVQGLEPFTNDNLYRDIFEEVYDFSKAQNFKLSQSSSGVVINGIKSTTKNRDISFGGLFHISDVITGGLDIVNDNLTFNLPTDLKDYTICFVIRYWENKSFTIRKINSVNNSTLSEMKFDNPSKKFSLRIGRQFTQTDLSAAGFNGKRIIIWLCESRSSNIKKVSISNHTSILTLRNNSYATNQKIRYENQGGHLYKIMYSPNFFDIGSVNFHKVILQEKLDGTTIN